MTHSCGSARYFTPIDRRLLEDDVRIDFIPKTVSTEQIHFDFRVRRCDIDYVNSAKGIPAYRYHDFETSADIRPGQTVVIDGGIQRHTVSSGSAPETSSNQPNTDSARKLVGRIVDEIQTLLVVTAELVPQK